MEKSGFFNAHIVSGEYDRIYLAEDFADYFSNFIGNGVFGGNATELQVVANQPADMNIIVKPGRGFINGYWYENTDDIELRIDNADGVLNRIDNIVLRWDFEERLINLAVKKGTPASSAVAPNLVRDNEYYELKLAEVFISAGAISISNSNITDTRLDSTVCGPVVGIVDQIDASQYGSQLNNFINNYIERAEHDYANAANIISTLISDLQGMLDEETASYLLSKINTKLDKPVGQTLSKGYIYQKEDGSTKLVHGGEIIDKFKFSILVDNGFDGTPEAVEYLDDCYGFTPMTMSNGVLDEGDWAGSPLLDCFKPCVINNDSNEPEYFLNKNNLSKKLDGTNATLTGEDGDVMIQVSKLYGRVTKVGNKAKISIMNFKETDDCFCFNDIAGVENDYLYRGRYQGGEISGDSSHAMRSISGVSPKSNQKLSTFRNRAAIRGNGYHQNLPYLVFLWEFMFMLLFKTRQSQGALGKGATERDNVLDCGWSDSKGWIWGDQTGTNGVVFLGAEDFYGNLCEWVDGIILDNHVYKLTKDPSKFNQDGTGYEIIISSGLPELDSGYITQLQFTNDLCCLPANFGGASASSNTFFCDTVYIYDSIAGCANFGGTYNENSECGAFCWDLSAPGDSVSGIIGCRLCRENLIQN